MISRRLLLVIVAIFLLTLLALVLLAPRRAAAGADSWPPINDPKYSYSVCYNVSIRVYENLDGWVRYGIWYVGMGWTDWPLPNSARPLHIVALRGCELVARNDASLLYTFDYSGLIWNAPRNLHSVAMPLVGR